MHRLAEELSELGHEVTCFSFSPRPLDAHYGHVALAGGAGSRVGRRFAPALSFRRVNKERFDIVHYHGDDYLCAGGARRVRTFYGSALSEALSAAAAGRALCQALFYVFEWVSCLRRGTKTGISAATRRALPLVASVIPCGVPLSRFVPGSGKSSEPSVVFVGDFRSRKHGGDLLDIFTTAVRERHPAAQLTVVGPETVDVTGVRCLGRIAEDDLIAEYQRAWVCCVPSTYEGFGVPVIEAMACGTAVVAVDNPGVHDIITHERDGLLCTRRSLAASLLRLLGDERLRGDLAANGRVTASRYGMRGVALSYQRIYESLTRGRAR